MRSCEMPSLRLIQRSLRTSTSASRILPGSIALCPRASANGRPPTARPTSSRREACRRILTYRATRAGVLTLITLRSNDQFNTTVYGLDDRLRGITRMVVLMNKADIEENGLIDGDEIDLFGAAADAVPRVVCGLRVVTYNVPQGSCAGYYPECNPLLPLWHHAEGSHVPAAKSIPVRVHKRG